MRRSIETRSEEQVASPVVVGRHDVPRRPLGRGLVDHVFVGADELVAAGEVVDVGLAELPRLLRVGQPFPEPLDLLLTRDMEVDLHDRRSLVDE